MSWIDVWLRLLAQCQEGGKKTQVAKLWQVWICLLPFHSQSVSRLTKLTNQGWSRAADCNPTNKVVDRQLGPLRSSPDMFNPVWVSEKHFLFWIKTTWSEIRSTQIPHLHLNAYRMLSCVEPPQSEFAVACLCSCWCCTFCFSLYFSSWTFPGTQLKYCAAVQRRSIY